MQYLGHASTMAARPVPINCLRLTLTGSQPGLENLFKARFNILNNKGEFDDIPARLVDRRPVAMIPSTTNWKKPPQGRKQDKREGYDHQRLTDEQRAYMTAYTRGETS